MVVCLHTDQYKTPTELNLTDCLNHFVYSGFLWFFYLESAHNKQKTSTAQQSANSNRMKRDLIIGICLLCGFLFPLPEGPLVFHSHPYTWFTLYLNFYIWKNGTNPYSSDLFHLNRFVCYPAIFFLTGDGIFLLMNCTLEYKNMHI